MLCQRMLQGWIIYLVGRGGVGKFTVAMPERRLRFKGCDTEEVWLNARWQPFDPGWPRSMSIDTSGLPAQQTAEQILDRIRVLEAEP